MKENKRTYRTQDFKTRKLIFCIKVLYINIKTHNIMRKILISLALATATITFHSADCNAGEPTKANYGKCPTCQVAKPMVSSSPFVPQDFVIQLLILIRTMHY